MGLVWCRAESADFQQRLRADLAVWEPVLIQWRARLQTVEASIGSGPGQLTGASWNAAKTLFVDRLRPLVESGISACAWTRTHLDQYAVAEVPLLDDGACVNEDNLQMAVDILRWEIHELTGRPLGPNWCGVPDSLKDPVIKALLPSGHNVAKLKEHKRALKRKIYELRRFSAAVRDLFADELRLSASMSAAIASIRRGSLTADGTYVAAPGDLETWRDALAAYQARHPVTRRPVFDEGGAYGGNQSSLIWRWDKMSAAEQAIYAAIIRGYWPGLDDFRIRDVVNQMAEVGCGFMADTNTIMAHYADRPGEFEALFGFPFYAPDGTVNFERVFADFWCYVQSHRKGVDPTGATPGHMPQGILPTSHDFLKNYLADHGIKITTSPSIDGVGNLRTAIAAYYELKNTGATVILSADPMYYHDATGRVTEAREGFHAVVVTGDGVDAQGRAYWVISSWSQEYRIYLDEYATGTFDLDQDGVIDTDTDGDGRLDYQGWRDGQMQTINVDRLFVIESVSFR